MTLVVTELTSSYDNVDRTSYTTASISPAANSFLVVCWSTRHGTTAPAITVSGLSLTWTETEPEQVDGISAIGCWTAPAGSSPGSGTLTLACDGGVTAVGCSWHVLQVTGQHASGTVVQSPLGPTGATSTIVSLAFSTLGDANNAQILYAMHRADEAQTKESGWDTGTARHGSTPSHSALATWRVASADLTATQSWATSARYQALGLEIKSATPAGGTTGAVAFRGAGYMGGDTTVDWPAGYTPVANDYALAHVVQYADNDTITGSAGWTQLDSQAFSSTFVSEVWGRRLTGGEAAPDFSLPGGTSGFLGVVLSVYRGVDTSTALDVAVVSTTGSDLSTHTTSDPGALTTACAAVVSFVSARTVSGALGINVVNRADESALLGDALHPIRLYGGSAYADGNNFAMAAAMHHNIIPTQTDWPRTHIYRPVTADLTSGGWIDHAVVLRPAAPTIAPVPQDLRDAVRQAPLPTWGARCAGADTVHQTRLSVQVFDPFDGFNHGDASTWDNASWGDGVWAGPGRWVDITDRTRGLQWTVGADTPGDRPRIGTFTGDLDNADGDLSAWATTGDFVNGTTSWFRTGTLMRVCWTGWNTGGTVQYGRSIITGIVEDVAENTAENVDAWVTVTAAEPLSILAKFNGLEQVEQGTSEGVYARVERLLDDAGWAYGFWQWGPTGTVPAYTTSAILLGSTLAGERLAELYLTVDSVGVNLYSWVDGGIVVHNPTAGTPVATFSNDPTGGELPLASAVPYSNDQRILNVVIGAREGGHELMVVTSGDSVFRYGRIDTGNGWPRRDLICTSDDTVVSIIGAVAAARGNDYYGIDPIDLDCDQRPAELFFTAAQLRLFDNVDVRYVHPTAQANELEQASYVDGMTHRVTRIGPQFKWLVTMSLARHPA